MDPPRDSGLLQNVGNFSLKQGTPFLRFEWNPLVGFRDILWTEREAGRQADRQTERQPARQAGKQTQIKKQKKTGENIRYYKLRWWRHWHKHQDISNKKLDSETVSPTLSPPRKLQGYVFIFVCLSIKFLQDISKSYSQVPPVKL